MNLHEKFSHEIAEACRGYFESPINDDDIQHYMIVLVTNIHAGACSYNQTRNSDDFTDFMKFSSQIGCTIKALEATRDYEAKLFDEKRKD